MSGAYPELIKQVTIFWCTFIVQYWLPCIRSRMISCGENRWYIGYIEQSRHIVDNIQVDVSNFKMVDCFVEIWNYCMLSLPFNDEKCLANHLSFEYLHCSKSFCSATVTAAGVLPCGSPNKKSRWASTVPSISYVWSFRVSRHILT